MTLFESVHNVFYKYFQFSGRSVRSEYWYFCLFLFTVDLLLSLLEAFFYTTGQGILSVIFGLGTVIPSLSVACRRLHDVSRSGWWLLISLTIVGLIPLLYWMCKRSDNGENRFGAPP